MSMPEAVLHQPRSVPPARRAVAYAAVGAARLLATQPPRRIRAVLGHLRRGTTPASFARAEAARDTVVAVSLHCAAREGCLARSLATVLLCRLSGRWATWCVGALERASVRILRKCDLRCVAGGAFQHSTMKVTSTHAPARGIAGGDPLL